MSLTELMEYLHLSYSQARPNTLQVFGKNAEQGCVLFKKMVNIIPLRDL